MPISPYIPAAAIVAPELSSSSSAKSSAASASPAKIDPKLMDSCKQFEGQFFDMMLQEMRKTVPDDPTLGDDAHEQQIFQGMMDDNIAQQMAKHAGGNDLAAQMYKQLSEKKAADAAASTGSKPLPVSDQPYSIGIKAIPVPKKTATTTDNEQDHDSEPNQ